MNMTEPEHPTVPIALVDPDTVTEEKPVTVRVAAERHWYGTDEQEIEAESAPAAQHWDSRCWNVGRPS
jgi:hypothetical protein